MALNECCIVDNTINPPAPVDGLTGLTESEAIEWLNQHQEELENFAVVDGITHGLRYSYQKENWPTETEE